MVDFLSENVFASRVYNPASHLFQDNIFKLNDLGVILCEFVCKLKLLWILIAFLTSFHSKLSEGLFIIHFFYCHSLKPRRGLAQIIGGDFDV